MTNSPEQKNTKILYISRAHGTHAGGMERFSFEIANTLKKMPGISITVASYAGPKYLAPLWAIGMAFRLIITAGAYDCIYLADPVLLLPGWVAKTLHNKKIVVNVHGLDITHPNPIYQAYLSAMSAVPSHIFPISAHVENIAKVAFPNIPATRITPAVSDEYYNPSVTKQDLVQIIGEKALTHNLLFTNGRLAKRKGQAWFIGHVLPKLPKDTLYIISGDGAQKEEIKKIIKLSGTQDQVVMLGRVSAKTLETLYNSVDIFIQPNIPTADDVEGFGLVLLEASLCERVVIASNLEGIKDALKDKENGLLVTPEDESAWINTVTNVLEHKDEYKELAKRARQYTLQNYTWEKTGADIANVLKSL